MNCPYCDSKLKEGPYERFENLIEHVEDPNGGQRKEKPTWVCKSPTCVFPELDAFWDEYGDFYTGENWYSEEFKGIKALLLHGTTAPGNSFALKLALEERARAWRSKELRIGNFKYSIQKYSIYTESGILVSTRYELRVAKKSDDDDTWFVYVGFWRMLKHCIRDFHRQLKEYTSGEGNEYTNAKLLEEFEPLKNWQKKDNYRKVYKWYLNTFFKGLKEELEYDL